MKAYCVEITEHIVPVFNLKKTGQEQKRRQKSFVVFKIMKKVSRCWLTSDRLSSSFSPPAANSQRVFHQ